MCYVIYREKFIPQHKIVHGSCLITDAETAFVASTVGTDVDVQLSSFLLSCC